MSHYQRYTELTEKLVKGRFEQSITEEEDDQICDQLAEWWYELTPNERTAAEVHSKTLLEMFTPKGD